MSLGLPLHLAPQHLAAAFAASQHVIGGVSLAGALVIVSGMQAAAPGQVLWPAAVAVLVMGGLLIWLDRRRTMLASVAFLLVGTACVYWYAITLFSNYEPVEGSDAYSLVLLKFALITTAGVGVGTVSRLTWCMSGYVLGELVTVIAAVQVGEEVRLDVTALVAAALTVIFIVLMGFSLPGAAAAGPSLHRAARDQELAAVRRRMEMRAAALLHDTVLNDLGAIAKTNGPLPQRLRANIQADLERVLGEDWLDDEAIVAETREGAAGSPLGSAIEHAREQGLNVEVTGDASVATRLNPERARALGQAVRQCLVNIIRHAEVPNAEVVVYDAGDDVAVMVIDAGIGFDESAVPVDRMGLRTSVHIAIGQVGGSVAVWSALGRGTTVLIRVPS